MSKEIAHALVVVNPANALRQQGADIDGLDLGALQLQDLVGHCVGHHHLGIDDRNKYKSANNK